VSDRKKKKQSEVKAELEKAEKEQAAARKAKKKAGEQTRKRSRGEKRRTHRAASQKEWDDLAKETRLMKKLKQGKHFATFLLMSNVGKITDEQFDKEMGYS
jgi:hypothetical protein